MVGLSTINPQQGVEGAGFAIREAMANQFRSLRNRFDISPDVVASSIGKSLTDLRRDPNLTLEAISAFTDAFVGPETIRQLSETLSVQGTKLRGALEQFFKKIGDAGFYDRVLGTIRGINTALESFLSKGNDEKAREITSRISASLSMFFESILALASSFVSAISGEQVDLSRALNSRDANQIAEVFAAGVDGLRKMSQGVLLLVGTMAVGVAQLSNLALGDTSIEGVRARVESLRRLQAMDDPAAFQEATRQWENKSSSMSDASMAFGIMSRPRRLTKAERTELNIMSTLLPIADMLGQPTSQTAPRDNFFDTINERFSSSQKLIMDVNRQLVMATDPLRESPLGSSASLLADTLREFASDFDKNFREVVDEVMHLRELGSQIMGEITLEEFRGRGGGERSQRLDAQLAAVRKLAASTGGLPSTAIDAELKRLIEAAEEQGKRTGDPVGAAREAIATIDQVEQRYSGLVATLARLGVPVQNFTTALTVARRQFKETIRDFERNRSDIRKAIQETVSYTHLTLPTTERV